MQVTRNKSYRAISILFICVLIMSIMTGCSGSNSENSENVLDLQESQELQGNQEEKEITNLPLDTVMLTVNDKTYSLGDIMYVIYYLEEDYNSTALGFEEQYGIDFWNDIYDETTNETGEDLARKSMMETAAMMAVLPPIAEKAGYTCTDMEIEEIKEDAERILDGLSKEYLERTGFKKDSLTEMIKKFLIVNKYVLDQIDKQNIDEDEIRSTIDPNAEENKQVRLEYIFLGTQSMDELGEEKHIGPEETMDLLKKGKKMLAEVEAGKNMEEVYNDTCSPTETNIYYNEEAILNADLEEGMLRAIGECKEGQLYDQLVETEEGYYIFRLISNNATDAYENNVAEAINAAKVEAYDETYQQLLSTYSVVQNNEAWEKLVLGNYAYFESEEESNDSEMANDDEFFDLSGLTGGSESELPDNAADGDDGSVG